MTCLMALAYVAETAMATQASYQIAGLKAQQSQLMAQQQQIRYQISIQTSAGRLDGEAIQLGMVRPPVGSTSRAATCAWPCCTPSPT